MLNLNETKKILEENNILPQQSLGQNFLISHEIIEKTLSISQVTSQNTVLEIGPGLGSLTSSILMSGAKVYAYEIDRDMIAILTARLGDNKNLFLEHQDILNANLSEIFNSEQKLKIIANLPYYISTEIVEKLICDLPFSESMTLMLQKEAVQRMTLGHNNSRYGPTAILLRLYGKITNKINVPAHCFYPRPKISSQVIYIERSANSVLYSNQRSSQIGSLTSFRKFLVNCFAQRRKTLRNNIKNNLEVSMNDDQLSLSLKKLGINPDLRPEQIPADKFWQLYESMANYIEIV